MTRFSKVLRWLFVPFSALFGFLLAFVLALLLNRIIHSYVWSADHAMPGKDFFALVLPYDGALVALLVVLCGAFVAPTHRVQAALALLFVGGVVAWFLVGRFYSPSLHHDVPVRLWWPILGTYLGGTAAVLTVCLATCFRPPP